MTRQRKTIDTYEVRADYGFGEGFECVTTEFTRYRANQQLRSYQENDGTFKAIKIVKVRDPKTNYSESQLQDIARQVAESDAELKVARLNRRLAKAIEARAAN